MRSSARSWTKAMPTARSRSTSGRLAGQRPDQEGGVPGVLGYALRVGDAAQHVPGARDAVEELELEEEVEQRLVGLPHLPGMPTIPRVR